MGNIETAAATIGLGIFFVALVGALIDVAASYFAVHSKSKHILELYIDGNTISIDVSSIDKENPKKLDHAIHAISAVRRAIC